jgi:broad-specificity NMP kinase
MKKLIIINGSPGIGKTAVSQELYQKLEDSVWLDGDWCWMLNPFQVTAENKRMVEDNISYLLNNFIANSSIKYIVFNWVIPYEWLLDSLIEKLSKPENVEIIKISLIARPAIIRQRLVKAGRSDDQIQASIERLVAYYDMNTIKVDSSDMTIEETADSIKKLICQEE